MCNDHTWCIRKLWNNLMQKSLQVLNWSIYVLLCCFSFFPFLILFNYLHWGRLNMSLTSTIFCFYFFKCALLKNTFLFPIVDWVLQTKKKDSRYIFMKAAITKKPNVISAFKYIWTPSPHSLLSRLLVQLQASWYSESTNKCRPQGSGDSTDFRVAKGCR